MDTPRVRSVPNRRKRAAGCHPDGVHCRRSERCPGTSSVADAGSCSGGIFPPRLVSHLHGRSPGPSDGVVGSAASSRSVPCETVGIVGSASWGSALGNQLVVSRRLQSARLSQAIIGTGPVGCGRACGFPSPGPSRETRRLQSARLPKL